MNKSKYVIGRDVFGKKYRISVNKLTFRPSVYGILLEKGRALVSKQFDGYDWPGGGVEINETIDQALEREFWEETGLKVKRGPINMVESSFFVPRNSTKRSNSILIYYLVRKIAGKLSIRNADSAEKKYIDMPEWIPINRIKKIKFYNPIDNSQIIQVAKRVKNKS
jgi:ADP-ribose pyrophosphatase YjhB (NUDIX family)